MDNYYESIKLELLEKALDNVEMARRLCKDGVIFKLVLSGIKKELEIAIAGLKESIGYPKPPVLGNRTTENQVAGGDEVLGWVPIKKEGE